MTSYKTPILSKGKGGKKASKVLNSSIPFTLSPPLHESTKIVKTPVETKLANKSLSPSENKKLKPKRVRRNYDKFKVGHEIDRKEGWVDGDGKVITVKDRIDALFKPKGNNTPANETVPESLPTDSPVSDKGEELPPDPRYPELLQSSITSRDIYDCQRLVTRLNFIREDMDRMVKETSPRIDQKIKDIGDRKREIVEMAKERLAKIDQDLEKHKFPSDTDVSVERRNGSFFTRPSFGEFQADCRKRSFEEPPLEDQVKAVKANTKRRRTIASESFFSSSQLKSPEPSKKGVIVTTSLHNDEQGFVREAVKKLGGFTVQEDVSRTTTHLVCGAPRRTMNVLKAVARGCWVVSFEWISASIDANKWLSEEEFETIHYFTNCRATRLSRQEADLSTEKMISSRIRKTSKNDDDENLSSLSEILPIFLSSGGIYVATDISKPRPSDMVHLIRLCCGRLVKKPIDARIVIAKQNSVKLKNLPSSITLVSPSWLLDSIMATKALPTDSFIISASAQQSAEM